MTTLRAPTSAASAQRRQMAPATSTTHVGYPPSTTTEASRHRTGHWAGLHGEDQPLTTETSLGLRSQRMTSPPVEENNDDLEADESYYPTRLPTSVRRYQSALTPAQQHAQNGRSVTVIPRRTSAPPPLMAHATTSTPTSARPRTRGRRWHWSVFVGLGMCSMLLLWLVGTEAVQWWQGAQDDWHYGRPRTFQMDVVVGHHDSTAHPSHFVAFNLHGQIEILELPGGDPSQSHLYVGATLLGAGHDLAPVTLSFRDVNGDGRLDMIVQVEGQDIVFLNDHGVFRPLKPGETVSLSERCQGQEGAA